MSRDIPEFADLRQLAKNRRGFSGSWPIARMVRLQEILDRQSTGTGHGTDDQAQLDAASDREVHFNMEFGLDETGIMYCSIGIRTTLAMICQRSLEPFELNIERDSTLGLIENMDDDAALPEQYEPYLIQETPFKLVTLIEDELILALPLVPVKEGEPVHQGFGLEIPDEAVAEDKNPFAVLGQLKQTKDRN